MPLTTERSQRQTHPELETGKKVRSRAWFAPGVKRAFPVALALFAAANLAFSGVLMPRGAGDDEKNAKGGDFWTNPALIDLAVHKYQEACRIDRPRVVLLGSSLVMFPFWAMDASFNPRIDDIAHYHRSMALSTMLGRTLYFTKNGGVGTTANTSAVIPDVPVYNLASAGQMSTDMYLYVSEFLNGPTKPEVVMLGIAPRDFGDSNLTSPMATVSFKRIVNLQNLAKYRAMFLPHFNEQAEFVANAVCYFYGRRWRMQRESDRLIERLDDAITKKAGVAGGADPASAKAFANTNINGLLAGSAHDRWESSLREYRDRYKGIGDRDISVQMDCLEKTVKLCQERGIKVVLVNMPLTKANQELMPDGFYQNFCRQIATIVSHNKKDVIYFDLSQDKRFTNADFWDTVHMNQLGGAKLLDTIVPAVSWDLQNSKYSVRRAHPRESAL